MGEQQLVLRYLRRRCTALQNADQVPPIGAKFIGPPLLLTPCHKPESLAVRGCGGTDQRLLIGPLEAPRCLPASIQMQPLSELHVYDPIPIGAALSGAVFGFVSTVSARLARCDWGRMGWEGKGTDEANRANRPAAARAQLQTPARSAQKRKRTQKLADLIGSL